MYVYSLHEQMVANAWMGVFCGDKTDPIIFVTQFWKTDHLRTFHISGLLI